MNGMLTIKQTSGQKVFFTSDLHLRHNKNFIWEVRGFKNSDDHTTFIINKINEMVKPNDILFHLGDFCLNTNEKQFNELLARIKCQNIYLLFGNHDKIAWSIYQDQINQWFYSNDEGYQTAKGGTPHVFNDGNIEIYPFRYKNIVFIGNYVETSIDEQKYILSHYPIHVFNNMKRGTIHLCGHSHGNLDFSDQSNLTSKILDISWDDFKKPLTINEVSAIMNKKNIFKPGDHHQ